MILEQGFYYLPEILLGNSYPRQDYEGGVVAAFSLAVLQELNGRNVSNPLALIQCEKPYREKPNHWPTYAKKNGKRYLRADLHLNTYPLGVGSSALAGAGWRLSNWVEAKYFRSLNKQTGRPKKNSGQSINTGSLLADLYRLLALVPRSVAKKQLDKPLGERHVYSGRYLLHVYTGEVSQHLSLTYGKGGPKRVWLEALTTPGESSVSGFSLSQEPPTVKSAVGTNLTAPVIDFSVSTLMVPCYFRDGETRYTCILNRIDEFRVSLEASYWGVRRDRKIECSDEDDEQVFRTISEFIGSRIGLKDDSEKNRPIPDDSLEEDPKSDDS